MRPLTPLMERCLVAMLDLHSEGGDAAVRRYTETEQAIAALSRDARAMFDVLPNAWLASGERRRWIEQRCGFGFRDGRFEAARDELAKAGVAYHRGGGVYARTLDAIVATGGSRGYSRG